MNSSVPSSQPRVSVIIPAFNGEEYIQECIESVLSQDYANLECVVVLDGCTDATEAIARQFSDIEIILNPTRSGANVSRNAGLLRSNGQYVKFLDHDDFLAPGAISRQVERLALLSPGQIIYGSNIYFFPDNRQQLIRSFQDEGTRFQFVSLLTNNIAITCPLYPREALELVSGFDDALTSKQEWALNLRISLSGYTFVYGDDLILYQRHHSGSNRISNVTGSSSSHLANYLGVYNSTMPLCPKPGREQFEIAWAGVFWHVGRYFAAKGDKHGAQQFFDQAIRISPVVGQKRWSAKYKLLLGLFGPYYTDRLFRNFAKWN